MSTTYMANAQNVERSWHIVDATGQTLGRLASEVASLIRGKHKPTFTPHVDTGDFVIVINASQITLTGNKMKNKMYYRHSLYQGGLKVTPASELLAKHPDRMIEYAVYGMLPKNRLGEKMKLKLKVYAGEEHPHQAQNPQPWVLRG